MGLNDPRHHLKVRMWNTWNIRKTETRGHILGWVAAVARRAPGGKLKDVVFSCHGNAAYLEMGEGFTRAHTGLFRAWRGLVERIWFRSCSVARIKSAGSRSDGNLFCSAIAQAAQCYVVASTELQVATTNRVLPYGQLDTFEGLLLSYGPGGGVTWSHRYPSTYKRSSGGYERNPD
jgi:hypothetical protein